MSANTQTNTVVASQEKKEKKPTLSAKYSKFLIFGYGFVKSLEAQGALSAEGVETAFAELKLMSSVEEQTQLYESLLNQSKETGKVMRKFITLRNKPPKAPRAKKSAKKSESSEAAGAEKKPRAKKTTRVENDSENDLVSQIVTAANNVDAAPAKSKEEKEAEKVAAKAAKEAEKVAAKAAKEAEKVAAKAAKEAEKVAAKAAKEAEKVAAKEAKAAAAKEAKEAKAASKKNTKAAEAPAQVHQVEEEEEEEEEEIHTQEIVIGNKSYLLDEENNVYSVDTHEQIGTFNTETQTISSEL
jgi:histone H1/5